MQTKQKLEKLKKSIRDFISENDVSYFFESEFKSRLLCLFFPSLDKTLSKLVYDMYNLTKLLNEIESSQDD